MFAGLDRLEFFHSMTVTGKYLFLHGNLLREAVWSPKIHVQIIKFMCCLNMDFTWKGLHWALIWMHDVTRESVVAVTDHFADALVRENTYIWHCGDVMMFESLTLTPFWFEKSDVRKWIFNVFSAVYASSSAYILCALKSRFFFMEANNMNPVQTEEAIWPGRVLFVI